MTDEPSTAALLTILDERNRVISELHAALREARDGWAGEKRRGDFYMGRIDPAASEKITALETEVSKRKVRIEHLESRIRYMDLVPYGLIAGAFVIGGIVGAVIL